MAVHGVARSTADVDVLAVDRSCLDAATWEPLRVSGIQAMVRPGGVDDPLAGVVRLTGSGEHPLDLVVGRALWQHAILDRARETRVEGVTVPVATARDMILLKLYAGGPQDAWDVTQLLAGAEGAALASEVDADVVALPQEARDLWIRIRPAG